jgi:NTF2 fold immunity protein
MQRPNAAVLLSLALLASPLLAQKHDVQPPVGLVPDSGTAIAIAVAVWTPIYGARQIASEKPYLATLADGQWTVSGSLPPGSAGGTAVAVISKADGRVSRVSHGK